MERTIVIGLGNPGPTYAGHRHNIGHRVADVVAGRLGNQFRRHRAGADVAEGRIGPLGDSVPVAVAKLHCYMNLSGKPTAALLRFYRTPIDRLIVIHDDIDLPFGTIRLKRGGGEGGHNGLRSISAAVGSRDYLRIRIGIDRPPGRMQAADYVLRNFSAAEQREVPVVAEQAADALEMLVRQGLTAAQNQLH